jgi:hypothetical protein
MVRPFHGFGHMPDQENFFNGLRHRHGSGNQNQTGTVVAGDKLTEVPRHRADIMRYQNPAQRFCDSENVRIRHTFRDDALRQFEINFRFAAKNTGDDILIKIGVGKETDSQPYLGRASSRARFSFLDRLSGSGGCLAANSSDNRS